MKTLLAGYDSAARAHPELRRGLAAQMAALGVAPSASVLVSPAPTASSPASPTAARRTGEASLAGGEAGLVSLCAVELLVASPAVARLLASIGAGAAQRATQLGARVPDASTPNLDRLRPSPSELDAWQAALGAEQAAVYGYGVLGALLSGGPRSQAASDYQLHRARRDALESRIAAAGATPHAAAAAYDLPFPVSDPSSARRLAALLEDRLAAVYANGVQAAENDFRGDAATQLRLAAVRSLSWGGTPTPFPGLPRR